MRVLIVKLSSMGDLVHALPAISDAARAIPGISFDWVIDAAFSEVAQWHPSVDRIICSSHRKWRKAWIANWRNGELKQFWRNLRQHRYDITIDAQSNCKSALITRLTNTKWRCGFDKNSAREGMAALAYNKTFSITKRMHAITRLRHLFADSLGYDCPDDQPNFAIDISSLSLPEITLPARYLVFVHNVSWESKAWPEAYWQQLIQLATDAGFSILLPWGNQAEHERARRLAQNQQQVTVLPRLSLSAIATLLHRSQGAICTDTGLSHIAAALDVPAVTLYGATDPLLSGTTGRNQIHLAAEFSCAPCYKKQCVYQGKSPYKPACFMQMTPAKVWQQFVTLTTP